MKTNIKDYTDQQLIDCYLDWCNCFISVGGFADYYGLSDNLANEIINKGRALFEAQAQ